MFGNIGGPGPSSVSRSSTGPGEAASSRRETQERSWIGVFSVVSRPALSLLQRYFPGRLSPSAPVDDWIGEELKSRFLGQCDDIKPLTEHSSPHQTYQRYPPDHHVVTHSRVESSTGLSSADSLHDLGIEHAAEMDVGARQHGPHTGYFSNAKSYHSHVLLSSVLAQETKHYINGKSWSTDARGAPSKTNSRGYNWWDKFWVSEEPPQSWLSKLSLRKEDIWTSKHCPPALGDTKAAVAKTTELLVQCKSLESMPNECTGHHSYKGEPTDNGHLKTTELESPRSSEQPRLNETYVRAIASSSEVAVLTLDQDNGYSSLEEEHTFCQLYTVTAPSQEDLLGATELATLEKGAVNAEGGEEGESTAAKEMEDVTDEDDSDIKGCGDGNDEATTEEGPSVATPLLTLPYCHNRSIAFIMGRPCSDDEVDSQTNGEFSYDDDDGFNSEGSSELLNSNDDESDSDDTADSETERLWQSLCQSLDPYNPRNFTASIKTSTSVPQAIPASCSASPCSFHSSPTSSPNQALSPPSVSPCPSPLRNSDAWDDSTSASEADEAESVRLWDSFSSLSDPYSPLNFQATLRTRRPTEAEPGAGCRGKKAAHNPSSPSQASAVAEAIVLLPQYKKEEADDRLDSGFSEPFAHTAATSPGCTAVKKVRFCEEVEEFFASCGEEEEAEDRRGPWEELARDRCRFKRRCHEVEQCISYCLEPRHRSMIYQRFTGHSTLDS